MVPVGKCSGKRSVHEDGLVQYENHKPVTWKGTLTYYLCKRCAKELVLAIRRKRGKKRA